MKMLDQKVRKILYHILLYRDGYMHVHKYSKEFLRFSQYEAETIIKIQYERLLTILKHAYETTSYYREKCGVMGLMPRRDIRECLSLIPILHKTDIEIYRQRMISSFIDEQNIEFSHTGGSSGNPTVFARDRDCTAARIGRQWGILERCGYPIGSKCALIWGAHQDLSGEDSVNKLKQIVRNYASAQDTLCCKILSEHDLHNFYWKLRVSQPSVLYGYPSAMLEFAEYISSRKLKPLVFHSVISTAERLTDDQRVQLTAAYKSEVFNLYCTREHGCIGFECGQHDGFHLDAGSVYVEIVNNEGRHARPGEVGDIIVTDLLNYGMPFIRYQIGDRGALSPDPCPCGCHLSLLARLEGRITDVLYRMDGSKVTGVILVDMFIDEPWISQFQIVQDRLDRIDVILVVQDSFDEWRRQIVINRMREYLTGDVDIHVSLVDEIPRNPISGKHQEVICNLSF